METSIRLIEQFNNRFSPVGALVTGQMKTGRGIPEPACWFVGV